MSLSGASAISAQSGFLTAQFAVILACMGLGPFLASCESARVQRLSGPCGDPRAREIESGSLDGSVTSVTSNPVDLNVLLDEVDGMGTLARRADWPFRTCMVSSYDRSSIVPQDPRVTPTGWYANHDWGNNFGWEKSASGRSEAVLLDVDGPGSIVRIWSATPTGTLRIYVDRRPDPVLEESMAPLLAGQSAPFLPPFAGMTAKGGNLEFPLPFREHVKVTWDRAKDGFYQITYRRYLDPSTEVTSFDSSSIEMDRLAAIRDRLQKPNLQEGGIVSDQTVLTGSSPELAITAAPLGDEILNLQIHPSVVDATSLRGSILSLRFDGAETVRAPLGDFFGAGPGLVPHATLPLEATADGVLTCRFVMPFRQSAVIRIEAAPGFEATVTVSHRAADFDEKSYYFHAHWTARGPIPVRPYRDILLTDLIGQGAYVGTFLAVENYSQAWWGEGDEKIWVDDDPFPSLFGTGTEDYFGQGYCTPDIYNHPYRAQSLAAGGYGAARGSFSLLRTHVLDPIRFATKLRFFFELWHWDATAQVSFDTVTYFYLAPDSGDNLPLPGAEDFRLPRLGS